MGLRWDQIFRINPRVRLKVRVKVTTIILGGPTESIVSLLHKEEMSGLRLVSGLGQRISLLCSVNSASIISLICFPSPLFHNIKTFFPVPMKVESELSKNLEFPDGKYLYIIMGPSSHTTEE